MKYIDLYKNDDFNIENINEDITINTYFNKTLINKTLSYLRQIDGIKSNVFINILNDENNVMLDAQIDLFNKTKYVLIKPLINYNHSDLSSLYENKLENPCSIKIGDEYISYNAKMPENFCVSAWMNLEIFVYILSIGGFRIYGNWMKNKNQAIISCNDGFRPVSFLLEKII